MLAVAIYGRLGILGIIFGWILCHFYGDEKTLVECIRVGFVSGITAYISLLIWQWCCNIGNAFEGLTSKLAIILVLLSALISALIRYFYLNGIDPSTPFLPVFFVGLCGDILGSFIVLYAIKVGIHLLRRLSKA